MTRKEPMEASRRGFSFTPKEDNTALWLCIALTQWASLIGGENNIKSNLHTTEAHGKIIGL